jgi:signal transduction histidine kinase
VNEHPRLIRWLTHPIFQAAFAVLALGAIVYFAILFCFLAPYAGVTLDFEEEIVMVEDVDTGGPAEQAGIQAGDRILSIDGQSPIEWILGGPLYKPSLSPGATVIVKVQRRSRTLTSSVTLGSYVDSPSLFGMSIGMQLLALGVWSIGLVLCLFTPPHDVGPRLMGMCCLTGGVAVSATGLDWWSSLNGYTTMMVAGCLASALLAIAHFYFPAPAFSARRRKYIACSLAAVALLLSAMQILEGRGSPEGLGITDFAGISLYGTITGFQALSSLIGIGLLVRSRFAVQDANVRRQVSIIMLGTALGGTPYAAVALFDVFGSPSPLIYTYAILFSVFVPLSYAYVIYQRRLVRVDFAINRAVVLFVFTLLTLAAFTLLSLGAARALDLPDEAAFLGGAAAASASLFAPTLRHAVQRRVDRILYGCHYDFSTVTSTFSERFAQAVDRRTLTHLLARDLADQMGIRQAMLFLAEGDELELQSADGQSSTFPLDDEMCQTLLAAKEPVRADPLWEKHPAAQERWGPFAWARLFVPLVFQDRLHGLLLLSDRFFGDIYSAADTRIIAAVAHQAALACENVRLVESLRGLNRRLVRDDEAQRKQVTRDLHDTALQQLFFVKQGLFRHKDTLGTQIDLLDDTIGTLRRTIRGLRPPLLDQGLAMALKGLVDEMREVAGGLPTIALQSNVKTRLGLSDEQATALYRIAQEALANALKHAQAKEVVVTMEEEKDGVRLGIADDGVGVPEEREGHYGLAGMRERAAMIGAQLDVASTPGQGTQITVEVTC